MRWSFLYCALTISLSALPMPSVFGAEKIAFNRDIRPILSEKCFACHGPDEDAREALRRSISRSPPDSIACSS